MSPSLTLHPVTKSEERVDTPSYGQILLCPGAKGWASKSAEQTDGQTAAGSTDAPVVEKPAADLLSISKNPFHPLPSSHCLDNRRVLHKSQWLDISLFTAELVYKGH